ncbi:hypothetical protein [Viridibacillus arvi]|uniref:hypothetical protein n=1 Tax=Viridibacillus arvi TaxID=263475 RepID=UPI0034CFF079
MSNNYIPFYIQTQTITQTQRKVRSDKCRDIKFPVTKEEQIRLKSACKLADYRYKQLRGNIQKLTQTRFNTLLLKYALNNERIINWNRSYVDSKVYMHTKPNEEEYKTIGGPYGISITRAISDRKSVYCLVISALEIFEQKGEIRNEFLS